MARVGIYKEKGLINEAFFCSSISPISELFFQDVNVFAMWLLMQSG